MIDRKEWLKAAKNCQCRVFDSARELPFKLGHSRSLGNPLCMYGVCGHRCTYNLCPFIKKNSLPPSK